jgi:hypothetical protein
MESMGVSHCTQTSAPEAVPRAPVGEQYDNAGTQGVQRTTFSRLADSWTFASHALLVFCLHTEDSLPIAPQVVAS